MVEQEVLDALLHKEIGGMPPAQFVSWAVFGSVEPPAEPFDKGSVLTMPPVSDRLREVLHTEVVLVALNPGNAFAREPWANFHTSATSGDDRLAELCRETRLWGVPILDLFPLEVDSDSPTIDKAARASRELRERNVKAFEEVLDDLQVGGPVTLVCLGRLTETWARRLLVGTDGSEAEPTARSGRRYEVVYCPHYSPQNAYPGPNPAVAYAADARSQIEDQLGSGWLRPA